MSAELVDKFQEKANVLTVERRKKAKTANETVNKAMKQGLVINRVFVSIDILHDY